MMNGISTTSHGEVRWARTELHALIPGSRILFGAGRILEMKCKMWDSHNPTVMTLDLRDLEDGTRLSLEFGVSETVRMVLGTTPATMH